VSVGQEPIAATPAREAPRPFGQALAHRYLTRANGLRLLSLVVVFGIWEAWGRANEYFASYPTAIWGAATENFFPVVLPAFVVTLTAMFVGMLIAIPIGMAIGFAMGRIRLFDVALTPYMYAIYATPRIALIPILVLWLGIDFNLRITIVALGAVFPVIINTYVGTKNADPELLDVGRVFTASNWQVLRSIIIPSAAPFVFAGVRIGIGRAVSGVIVAEMTSALTGIGRLLISYAKYLQIAELFVGVMALGLFSLVLYSGLARLQRRLTPWADTERAR
jgi:ABC-type nitrate/sulfonate/bicarbonate transport system permease component